MSLIDIKPYDPEHDLESVLSVWHKALAHPFSLNQQVAHRVFNVPATSAYTTWFRGELVGFSSVQGRDLNASIQSLFVEPSVQRQGVGAALYSTILAQLRKAGVTQIQLGGGEPRLFPGVPDQAPAAIKFFNARGWEFTQTSIDMVQSLRNYSVSNLVSESIKQLGITLEFCTVARVPELLTFIQHEFPSWVTIYEHIISLGDRHDCLLAIDKRQAIVAALILYGPWSHPSRTDTVWQAVFGQDLGVLGVVVTASSHRRLGIGSALVSYATEVLKARGASHSFIGWTWAEDFYRKLGYEVWQTYKMSWRVFQAAESSSQT